MFIVNNSKNCEFQQNLMPLLTTKTQTTIIEGNRDQSICELLMWTAKELSNDIVERNDAKMVRVVLIRRIMELGNDIFNDDLYL